DMMLLGVIRVWDLASGKLRYTIKEGAPGRTTVVSPVVSPNGRLLAYTALDGQVRLIDMANGEKLHAWKITSRRQRAALAFSAASGRLYARLAGHPTIQEWDVQTGQQLRTLKISERPAPTMLRPNTPVGCLALSTDGKLLAVGGDGNALHFIDLDTGKDRPSPGGHSDGVGFLHFAAAGKSLLTRADRTLRWWEPTTGKELKRLDLPAKGYSFLASPDGRYLAVENERHLISLIEQQTGKQLAEIGPVGAQVINNPTFFFSP